MAHATKQEMMAAITKRQEEILDGIRDLYLALDGDPDEWQAELDRLEAEWDKLSRAIRREARLEGQYNARLQADRERWS